MTGFLDDQMLTVTCTRCGHIEKRSIGWIKANSQCKCICGATVNLRMEKFRRQLAETEASYDRYKKTISDNNKRY
jgi:hypothetical protein